MLKFVVLLALISGLSAATTRGTTQKPQSCKGHLADGFFVDPDNKHVFHECSHGRFVGTFTCPNNLVFDEVKQACAFGHDGHDVKCPKPNGMFPYPGNPHKFIECFNDVAYVKTCSAQLVFDEEKQDCIYNDHGLTWPTDAPTTPKPNTTPTGAATTKRSATDAPATKVTAGPTKGPTSGPVVSTAKPECSGKGFFKDPADDKKFRICKNGKWVSEPCPDGMKWDDKANSCA